MANPITSDNIPSPATSRSRNIDAPPAGQGSADGRAAPTRDAAGATDVERAQQRLAQETHAARGAGIESLDQARARIAQLQLQIATDPAAVVKAHGLADTTLFQAAVARPTA